MDINILQEHVACIFSWSVKEWAWLCRQITNKVIMRPKEWEVKKETQPEPVGWNGQEQTL